MSERQRRLAIRRILVALDASPHSQAALEAAIELAARFEAELTGLFVEDVNLLRLAELPFVQEVGLRSARRRSVDAREMERQIRAQTVRIRQRLAGATERTRIRWSFRVSRGAVTPELLAAEAEADVIILGKAGSSVTRGSRMGSTTRQIVAQGAGLALVLQEGICLGAPVMVIFDGSQAAQEALDTAASLAEGADRNLTVLLVSAGADVEWPGAIAELREEALGLLEDEEVRVRFRPLLGPTVGGLVRAIHDEGCGLLVVPARSPLLAGDRVAELLDEIRAPVLVVR